MRIIANHRDYYDCIQAHGQDRSIVYVRKPEIVRMKHDCLYRIDNNRAVWPFPSFPHSFSAHAVRIVGFCGNIYPMIELVDRDYQRWSTSPIVRCFNIEDVDAFVDAATNNKDFENYRGEGIKHGWRFRWHRGNRKDFLRFFDECEKKKASYRGMFEDRICPVFVATESGTCISDTPNIVYDALLRPHEFFRVFDTYAAFQEIAMFLGNIAIPQKPMPIISDEMKIHSHGFNEWSFRTPPGGSVTGTTGLEPE